MATARKVRSGSLVVADDLFERLDLEAGESRNGNRQVAVLASESPQAHSRLFFLPHPLFRDTDDNPFTLPLAHVRYAALYEGSRSESALMASVGAEPPWLAAEGVSLHLADPKGKPAFAMVHREGRLASFHCAPSVAATIAPLAGTITEPTAPREDTRLAFVEEGEGGAEVGGACGHLAPCLQQKGLDLCLPGCCISIVRPDDLLALCFELKNLRLRTGFFRRPRLERCGVGEAHLIVHFPPQHIAEQAFLLTLETIAPDPPTPPPVQSRIAGPTRLAFRLLPGINEIPFTLESLLDWSRFEPELVPAKRAREDIAEPGPDQTAIEAPYRLVLSPEATARWLHSVAPVTHDGRTEALAHPSPPRAAERSGSAPEARCGLVAGLPEDRRAPRAGVPLPHVPEPQGPSPNSAPDA